MWGWVTFMGYITSNFVAKLQRLFLLLHLVSAPQRSSSTQCFFFAKFRQKATQKQMAANSRKREKKLKRGFCHIDLKKKLNDSTNMTIQTWISVPNKEQFKVSPTCP